jgi:hypothetical protein
MGLLQQCPVVAGGRVRERRTSPSIGLGGSVRSGARRDDAHRQLGRDRCWPRVLTALAVAGCRTPLPCARDSKCSVAEPPMARLRAGGPGFVEPADWSVLFGRVALVHRRSHGIAPHWQAARLRPRPSAGGYVMLTMLSVAEWVIIGVWAPANHVSRGTRTVHRSFAFSALRSVVLRSTHGRRWRCVAFGAWWRSVRRSIRSRRRSASIAARSMSPVVWQATPTSSSPPT